MNSIKKQRIFVFVLVLLSCFRAGGQTYTPDVVDTVETSSRKAVLYENHTWQYITSIYNDDQSAFDSFWDNDQIFAYLKKKSAFPEYTEIDFDRYQDSFTMPINGKIWGGFSRYHSGMDIELKKGDPVRTAFGGKVRYARYNRGGYGYLVIIRHYNGLETWYAHLSEIWVSQNQFVTSGDVIGLGGSTGRSRGAHLHFEVRFLDKALDPTSLIDFDKNKLAITKLVLDRHSLDYDQYYKPPAQTSGTTGAKYYKIRKGDTLSSIAKRNGTNVKAICNLNNMTPKTTLKVGRTIRIK